MVKLQCLNFTHMEPYLVLRRDLRTPLYHPYYVNYGFNKVSFVESLRYESRMRGALGSRLSVLFDYH